MSKLTTRQYAEKLLDRLIELDDTMTAAYYELGQILSAIEHGKLWEILEYQSMAHLVEEELSFTSNTASKYWHTYRHFKRLKYTKLEAIGLIREFSFTRIAEYLPNAQAKVGTRAVRTQIEKILANHRQLNFTVNAEQYEVVQRALRKHGASKSDAGRWEHSSEAFVDIMKEAARKPQLKAVS